MDIDCGISIELPEGYWGMITGRSSTLRRRGLLVAQGIIDGGYRGPIYSGVWNLTDRPVSVSKGERVAQLIPFSNSAKAMVPVIVDELSLSDRGVKGFGSSGA
jgi:dUTP pyrophosphatase